MKILLKEKTYQIWFKSLARKAGEYCVSQPDEVFPTIFGSYEEAVGFIGRNKDYFNNQAIEKNWTESSYIEIVEVARMVELK